MDRLLGWFRRGPVTWGGESFVRFRAETVGLLRRRWHVLTLATLAGHLSVFLALRRLPAHARRRRRRRQPRRGVRRLVARAAARLDPDHARGIGIVEVGLTTALIGFGGANAEVVAAVLVYRFLTLVPTLVLGLVLGATWRKHQPAELADDS